MLDFSALNYVVGVHLDVYKEVGRTESLFISCSSSDLSGAHLMSVTGHGE